MFLGAAQPAMLKRRACSDDPRPCRRTEGKGAGSYLQAVEDDEEDQHPEVPVSHVQSSPQPGDRNEGKEVQDQGDL